jgi:PAS domain S-box-containing protein
MSENKHNLLFVDDEEDIIAALNDTFCDNYNIFKTTQPKEALEIIGKEDIALIISDQRMPEMTGSELLAKVFEQKPETIRILLTGYADMNAAIDAINNGAIHKYVEKPWDDEELMEMVATLVEIYEDSMEKFSVLSNVQNVVKHESTFRAIINNFKEGACAIDADGNIYFANTPALSALGYKSIDKATSQTVFNLSAGNMEEFKQELKKNKKVKSKIFSATCHDNTSIDVLLTPVFGKDGEQVVGVIFQAI